MEILFGFNLNFLIGCSHFPWNASYPYSMDDNGVKNDYFQRLWTALGAKKREDRHIIAMCTSINYN